MDQQRVAVPFWHGKVAHGVTGGCIHRQKLTKYDVPISISEGGNRIIAALFRCPKCGGELGIANDK